MLRRLIIPGLGIFCNVIYPGISRMLETQAATDCGTSSKELEVFQGESSE
jgi:hypothetical protein